MDRKKGRKKKYFILMLIAVLFAFIFVAAGGVKSKAIHAGVWSSLSNQEKVKNVGVESPAEEKPRGCLLEGLRCRLEGRADELLKLIQCRG